MAINKIQKQEDYSLFELSDNYGTKEQYRQANSHEFQYPQGILISRD